MNSRANTDCGIWIFNEIPASKPDTRETLFTNNSTIDTSYLHYYCEKYADYYNHPFFCNGTNPCDKKVKIDMCKTQLFPIKKSEMPSRRVNDLRMIQTALEKYRQAKGGYPAVSSWRSQCRAFGNLDPNQVIPGLVPQYLSYFPIDPQINRVKNTSCYLYTSNGRDYKILDHVITGYKPDDYKAKSELIDPARDGGSNSCNNDGSNIWSWAVYTPGYKCI